MIPNLTLTLHQVWWFHSEGICSYRDRPWFVFTEFQGVLKFQRFWIATPCGFEGNLEMVDVQQHLDRGKHKSISCFLQVNQLIPKNIDFFHMRA